jgi:indoleamine 2,3-dioxygenase
MPILDIEILNGTEQLRRAYVVLSFLGHGYLYGVTNSDNVEQVMPKQIAVPWFKVATKLRINPVISYTGVGLWNWKLLSTDQPIDLEYNLINQ